MRLSLLPMTLPPLLLLLSLISTVTTKKECEEGLPGLGELQNAMKGINNLGFDLLRELWKHDNLMISPYTLWRTFSYAAVGAEKNTLKQILKLLGLSTKTSIIHIAETLGLEYNTKKSDKITLAHATQIYLMKNFNIERCNQRLSNMISHVDFANPEPTCNAINDYVNKRTKGEIQKIISPSMIRDDTRMVMIDAIFFKGLWNKGFTEDMTGEKEFYSLKVNEKHWVRMMYRPGFPLMTGDVDVLKARVVQLPYSCGFVFMTIVVPEVRGLVAFKKTLDNLNHTTFMKTIKELKNSRVNLHLPKFTLETELNKNIVPTLEKMGIENVFDHTADLSSFSAGLYIDQVIHKTKIQVNEKGGTSGSANVIEQRRGRPESIKLNRPFIFVIHTEDIVLFTGAFLKPDKNSQEQEENI